MGGIVDGAAASVGIGVASVASSVFSSWSIFSNKRSTKGSVSSSIGREEEGKGMNGM